MNTMQIALTDEQVVGNSQRKSLTFRIPLRTERAVGPGVDPGSIHIFDKMQLTQKIAASRQLPEAVLAVLVRASHGSTFRELA